MEGTSCEHSRRFEEKMASAEGIRSRQGFLDEGPIAGVLHLWEQSIRRTAEYLRDVGDLVREGSIEPRLWIGSIECFWSGLAEDFGDSLRITVGSPDGSKPIMANDLQVPVLRITDLKVGNVEVPIPTSLFKGQKEVDLDLPGLWQGQSLVLRRDVHFDLPKLVTNEKRRVRIRFFDLPKLTSGAVLVGPLVARRKGEENQLVGIIVVQQF